MIWCLNVWDTDKLWKWITASRTLSCGLWHNHLLSINRCKYCSEQWWDDSGSACLCISDRDSSYGILGMKGLFLASKHVFVWSSPASRRFSQEPVNKRRTWRVFFFGFCRLLFFASVVFPPQTTAFYSFQIRKVISASPNVIKMSPPVIQMILQLHTCDRQRWWHRTGPNSFSKCDLTLNSMRFLGQQKVIWTVNHSHTPHIYELSVEPPERTEKQQREGGVGGEVHRHRSRQRWIHCNTFCWFPLLSRWNVRHPHKPLGPIAIPY